MLPPHHRLNPTMRIVDMEDPAWDRDRYLNEIGDLEEDEIDDHPIVAYRTGATHYDLDAPGLYEGQQLTPRDYLVGEPRFYEARRLTMAEVATCLDRGPNVGRTWAFQLAVKAIDGFDFKLKPRKSMSDAQMSEVQDRLGADVVLSIGRMVIAASRAPTPAEGKPSGSLPGRKSADHEAGVRPSGSDPGAARNAGQETPGTTSSDPSVDAAG